MPNARLKNGILYVDPGGDPGHAQGGVVEFNGIIVSTQNSGWRQLLITRGAAT